MKNTNKRRVDRFVQVKKIIYNPNYKIPISPLVYNPKELEERLSIDDDFKFGFAELLLHREHYALFRHGSFL